MSYLSSGAQLLGNLEHTSAELLETTMQERGRGFASDNESWAEIKAHLERAKKATGDLEKVHKEMWDAIKDQNEDAYGGAGKRADARRALRWRRNGWSSRCRQDRRGDDGRVSRHDGRQAIYRAADEADALLVVRAGVRRLLVDGARSRDARDPLRAREGLGGGENDDQRLEKRARREVLPLHDRQLPRRALPAVRAGPADESQKRHAGMGHAGRERMKKAADRWHRSTATKKNTHERRFSSPPL